MADSIEIVGKEISIYEPCRNAVLAWQDKVEVDDEGEIEVTA